MDVRLRCLHYLVRCSWRSGCVSLVVVTWIVVWLVIALLLGEL